MNLNVGLSLVAVGFPQVSLYITNPNNTLLFGQIPQHQITSNILASILNPPGPKNGSHFMIPVFFATPKTWRKLWESCVWASNIRKGDKLNLTKKSVRSQTAQMLRMGLGNGIFTYPYMHDWIFVGKCGKPWPILDFMVTAGKYSSPMKLACGFCVRFNHGNHATWNMFFFPDVFLFIFREKKHDFKKTSGV